MTVRTVRIGIFGIPMFLIAAVTVAGVFLPYWALPLAVAVAAATLGGDFCVLPRAAKSGAFESPPDIPQVGEHLKSVRYTTNFALVLFCLVLFGALVGVVGHVIGDSL